MNADGWPARLASPQPEVKEALTTVSDGRVVKVFDRGEGWREGTVAEVEVEIIEGNIIITVRRFDEAAAGPISVVMV